MPPYKPEANGPVRTAPRLPLKAYRLQLAARAARVASCIPRDSLDTLRRRRACPGFLAALAPGGALGKKVRRPKALLFR